MNFCRICKNNKIILLLKINKFPKHIWPLRDRTNQVYLPLEIFGCKNCGTIQLGHLNQKFINSLYNKNFFLLNSSTSFKSIMKKNDLFIKFIKNKMGKYFFHNKNILDVGGYDFFISRDLGYKNVAICDPNAPKNMKNMKKIKIIRKFFSKKFFNRSSIDIIIAKHIIEHIRDLSAFLNDISYVLKKDGFVIFEVPDLSYGISSENYSFFYHQHLTYFDAKTLKYTLSINGFKIRYIENKKGIIRTVAFKKSHEISEIKPNYKNFNYLKNFKKMLRIKENKIIKKINLLIKDSRLNSQYFYIYGAGGSATIFLSLFKKINKKIIGIIDGNKEKEGLNIGANNFKVLYNKKFFKYNNKIICLIILSSDFFDEIKNDILVMKLPYKVKILRLYPKIMLQNIKSN